MAFRGVDCCPGGGATDEQHAPRELAKLRQRSERTLARERQKGRGPKFIKDFGRIFYPEDEWEAWLARRPRYQSTSEYGGGNPGSTSPTSGRSQVQRVPVAAAEGKEGPSPTRDSPAAPADGERRQSPRRRGRHETSEKTNPPPQTEADIADTREQDRLPLNNLVDGEPLTGKSGERPSPRSHPGQLEQEISRGEKLDYWVREITAPSRQTLDGMLQIGARILEAEASGLSHEEIRQLQEKRLPFSSSDYSKYRNIAAHEGIIDPKYRERLPVARSTLYLLSLLPLAAFKTAVAQDKIHCRMSREDAEHLRDDAFAALGKAGKKKKARVAAKTQAQDRAQTGGRVESPGKRQIAAGSVEELVETQAVDEKGDTAADPPSAEIESGQERGQSATHSAEEPVASIFANKALTPHEIRNIVTLLNSIKGTVSGIRIKPGSALKGVSMERGVLELHDKR